MIGLLPIPWTMTAELFPLEIRGVAHSIAYSSANALMFASVQSYRSLERLCGGPHGVQWFFAVIAILGGIYAFIFLPETHKKKLNQIQDYFKLNTIFFLQKRDNNNGADHNDKKKKLINNDNTNKTKTNNKTIKYNDIVKSSKQTKNLLSEEV